MKGSVWLEPRVIVAYALSLLALAEMIDLTIVAVAIPQIMSSLNTDLSSIAMVATSYIVAAAIFSPLTGIAVRKFGMRTLTLFAASMFCITSVLCGFAQTLPEMIFFRAIQGVGGAFLPSIAQAYIEKAFHNTPLERPMVTLFASIIVLGPVIGNILGGWLTGEMNWRFIFFINVPICVVGFILVLFLMEHNKPEKVSIDYTSFFFVALGIGALEFFIDQGHDHNWFDSMSMIILFATSMLSLFFFIWRGILGSSVINFKLFTLRHINFIFSLFAVFSVSVLATAGMIYFPTMLQQIYNYPVETAGYITAPRGIAVILSAPLVALLSKRLGTRETMLFGMLIFAAGCIMLSHCGPAPSLSHFVLSTVLQGIGLMGIFIPIIELCYVGISKNESADASGLFNFFRTFGVSIGNAIAATVVSHQFSVSYSDLSSKISPYFQGYELWAQHLFGMPDEIKIIAANMQVMLQSALISFIDIFYFSGIALVLLFWLPFILKKPANEHNGLIIFCKTLYNKKHPRMESF